jgi:hypothetical protein
MIIIILSNERDLRVLGHNGMGLHLTLEVGYLSELRLMVGRGVPACYNQWLLLTPLPCLYSFLTHASLSSGHVSLMPSFPQLLNYFRSLSA